MIPRTGHLIFFCLLISNYLDFGFSEPINGPGMEIAMNKNYAYTYTALISNKSSTNILEKFPCTGTLISRRLVLTVAECIRNLRLEELEVIFRYISKKCLQITDELNPNRDLSSESGSDSSPRVQYASTGIYAAKKIMTSSMWLQGDKLSDVPPFNDLAIIQLDRWVPYGAAIISYSNDHQKAGFGVELVGWGKIDKVLIRGENKLFKAENDMVQFELPQKVPMTIMSKTGCEKKINDLSKSYHKFNLPNNIFCISSPTRDVALHGDIGGPVVFGSNHVIGVTVKRTQAPTPNWLDKGPVNFVLRLEGFRKFIQHAIDRDNNDFDLY